ncbi:MAG TPA: hypothetical protein ENN12_03085 [Epsilonproteobacteria bacterium]|nr:hypothetical protein [Campylobacterota bacterium]
MNILLINKNPIVSRLMELATQNSETQIIETKDTNAIANSSQYDIVFVDDGCCNPLDIDNYFQKTPLSTPLILIANKTTLSLLKNGPKGVAHILKKPFLPSHLVALLENIKEKKGESQGVLDLQEIATIKEVLQTQASELTTEKTLTQEDLNMIDFVFEQSSPSKEDALLKAIKKMKPKKIKKLLKDAKITLTLHFPKES